MKKILFSLFLISLLALSVSSAPQLPYIIYGTVDWNEQMLSGARMQVIHNGNTIDVTTNDKGNYVVQLSEYSNGDSVTIKVTDGCGTGDTCSKTFKVNDAEHKDYAVVDFSITGTLSCPPCNCNCGGGGGSSYVDLATEERCAEKFPCEKKVCPKPTIEECKETVCPVCEDKVCVECPECVTDEEKNNLIGNIIWGLVSGLLAIASLVLGKYSWFAGLSGLAKYRMKEGIKALKAGDYKEAEKQIQAAVKMQKTAVEKAQSGEYD